MAKKIKAITIKDGIGEEKFPRTYTKLVSNKDGKNIDDLLEGIDDRIKTIEDSPSKSSINVTYSELRKLVDSSQLIAGCWYRITDYITTTLQENTKNAYNQFDIIVLATSENTLSEEARACEREFNIENFKDAFSHSWGDKMIYVDTYEYNDKMYHYYQTGNEDDDVQMLVDFDDIRLNSLSDDIYQFVFWPTYAKFTHDASWEAGEDFGEDISFKSNPVNYFKNSNLDAWKIWYSLDNDSNRFAWADNIKAIQVFDESVGNTYIYKRDEELDEDGKCAWVFLDEGDGVYFDEVNNWNSVDYGDIIFTDTENLEIGTSLIMGSQEVELVSIKNEGKGVIYKMIDEFDNECPYDFKNIQFYRGVTEDGELTDFETSYSNSYLYTFSWIDLEGEFGEQHLIYDFSIKGNSGDLLTDEGKIEGCYNNVIKPCVDYDSVDNLKYILNNNVFLSNGPTTEVFGTYNNILNINCYDNSFGDWCQNNSFGDSCYFNSFGHSCYNNSFGHSCYNNSFGNYCASNSFGNYCDSNSFGNYCQNNSFGDDCRGNSLGDGCYSNSFGIGCSSNLFGATCNYNIFDDYCNENVMLDDCNANYFNYSCTYNALEDCSSFNCLDDHCYSNLISEGSYYNHLGNNCGHNIINSDSYNNILYVECINNEIMGDFHSLGNVCTGNTVYGFANSLGAECHNNNLSENSSLNTLGYGCTDNYIGTHATGNVLGTECVENEIGAFSEYNIFGDRCMENYIESGSCYNTFGNNCLTNALGVECCSNQFEMFSCKNQLENLSSFNKFEVLASSNLLGASCACNSFGIACNGNSIRFSNDDLIPNCVLNRFENGVSGVCLYNDNIDVENEMIMNVVVTQGMSEEIVEIPALNAQYQIKISKNSKGEVKVYCEADLIQ